MEISVFGTGMVGRALAGRLARLGHDVVVGTRNVEQTLARTEPDAKRTPAYTQWQQANPEVRLLSFPDAAAHGEVVFNAVAGLQSLTVLQAAGVGNLAGKVLVDLVVPLDYSHGRPPRLAFANEDSLGEQIQHAFPDARVIKTLNTMHVNVMIDPARVPGRHNVFLAGEDARAKEIVKNLLGEFGWPAEVMVDLGGIKAARTTEMYAPLLFALMDVLGTSDVNISVVRGPE